MQKMQLFAFATVTFLLAAGCLAATTDNAPPSRPHDVFVVQSYDPEYVWTQHINRGIQDGLSSDGHVVEVMYLDAKRQQDPDFLRAAGRKALARIKAAAPRVVITADDAAQAYLAVPLLMEREPPQVIFCGVNAPPAKYGFPAANVSGVRERWHYREGFSLVKKIVPTANRVAFLVETSESGGYVVDDLWEDLRQGGPFALEVVGAEQIRTFQEWQRRVRYYQSHADVLALGLYNALKDERTGKVVPPDEVMAWTNSVNTKPTLGFSDVARDHGILCGVLESGHEQGYLAGMMAREVLVTGQPAGRLPVRINAKGVVFVNMKTAERLGLRVPYEIFEAAGEVVR
jgi:ABC-type uncharacterized transport system substrate-binding protein